MYTFIRATIKNDLELHSQNLFVLLELVIKLRALCVVQTHAITELHPRPQLKIISNGIYDLNILKEIWELHICKGSSLRPKGKEEEGGKEEEEMLEVHALRVVKVT